MTGTSFRGLKNEIYTLAEKIGSGGEGDVFSVRENSSLVLKIYKDKVEQEKIAKLNLMVSLANEDLLRFAAWPIDLVRDSQGVACGFTMKKLEGFVPLHKLFTPMDRKHLFPDKGYNFLVHVARNLAAAFHKIHQTGIIVGDVNEANILVSNSGMISLIDCDSFQIRNGNSYHYCEVGMLRYTPPELLKLGGFERTIRTVNTDSFSLATLIFQLLFLGRAPFTGINPSSQEIDEETAIKSHEFAYSITQKNKRLLPAKNTLDINSLNHGLIKAFHGAFESISSRPSPLIWANELSVLAKELKACNKSKIHFYPNRMMNCPWCKFKDIDNIHYFLDDSHLRAMPELNNIEQFVNGFKLDPIHLKVLSSTIKNSGVKPDKIERKFYNLKTLNWIVYAGLIIATIVLSLQNTAFLVAGVILLILFANISPTKRIISVELAVRKKNFDNLHQELQQLVKQYNGLSEYHRYNDAAKKLTNSIEEFRKLPSEYSQAKKDIEEKHYKMKYLQFLQKFEVLYYPISGVGPAKKRLFYNAGIRTAADVGKLNRIKIAGIGPKNEQLLFDWQRQVGAGFSYQPDTLIITAEINQAASTIVKKRSNLELTIKQHYQLVVGLRGNVIASTQSLEKKYNSLLPLVQKAEANLQAFKNINT
jgi:DNA-binding helix-hairpin-helix protein with protein kinase domain